MIICGIKLTHDGGIAVIDNGELKFCIEMEKLVNNPRYSHINNLLIIVHLLKSFNYDIESIDQFVIDGWHSYGPPWNRKNSVSSKDKEQNLILDVAPYHEILTHENVLKRYTFKNKLFINGRKYNYSSYMHAASHILGAYSTSPFAANKESSYVLVWDGGQFPRLYYFNETSKTIKNLGHLFAFYGTIYSIIAQYFGPYKKTKTELESDEKKQDIEGYFGGHSLAGKIMSYIAVGNCKTELFNTFNSIYGEQVKAPSNDQHHFFCRKLRQSIDSIMHSDEDVLASFHIYIERLIIEKLQEKIEKHPVFEKNLCYSGGCALNIKWNSAIRNSRIVKDIYIPPFPNDSGSAIGTAIAEYFHQTGKAEIEWNVYQGPPLKMNKPDEGWIETKCTLKELAHLLWESGEPIVFLTGSAELGPRALGNRSIIASPKNAKMKNLLNIIKRREGFRPIAPICLEEIAVKVFDPGTKDPFMLYDHMVRDEWRTKVPAICHLDGSARVQTINQIDNPNFYTLLIEFEKVSKLPLLCNTSANYNGSGFFPDIKSASQWGRTNYIWCNDALYSKKDKFNFNLILNSI